ncbi:perilipin-2-like [Narcine bancroftii]|uniref:perilipin-2-like n=1 Tax=Narcine bancroftii TaxID=1343680 RepID=UPI0038310BE9
MAVEMSQNVVVRVAHLPLFTAAYNMVNAAYRRTKINHPYLRSLCEATEKGVVAITAVAVTSAMPILQKLEPQITFANDYACKGLDRMEEKLPFLLLPTNQIIANAKDVVATKVSGVKDTFANKISDAVDKTKETVHESVEMSMAIVNSSVNHVLQLHVAKVLNNGFNSALTSSEVLVDHYLPLTGNEQAKEGKSNDSEALLPSYYTRLESLSSKVCQRTYEQAMIAIINAKQQTTEVISQLHHNFDLQIDSPTMAIAQNLSQQLQTGCVMLVSSIWSLPQNIQKQVQCITPSPMEKYMMSKTSFKELPDQIYSTSKDQLTKMKELLDGLMDYLVNNTPLNWMVGPFYPQLTGSQHSDQEVEAEIMEEEQSEQKHSCDD